MTEDRRPLKTRDARWAQALAAVLVRKGASPNAISVAGLICAVLGGAALALVPDGRVPSPALFFAGAAGAQLRLLCNMLDGMVAVNGGKQSALGALYNESPDRVADIVLLAGAGVAVGQPWLGWMAATAAVMTAHVRTFGASLGRGHDYCGPLAKPHRMFFFTLGCLGAIGYPPALTWALWFIACGAFLTAARRIVRLSGKLT